MKERAETTPLFLSNKASILLIYHLATASLFSTLTLECSEHYCEKDLTMTLVARDIMTPHIKSVPESWTMQQFAKFLSDNEISGSPVIDEEDNVIGIATLKDIADFHLNNVSSDHEKRMTDDELKEARRLKQFIFEEMIKIPVEVRDIMTPIVFSVEEDAPIKEIADIMMAEHLHRIFVMHAGQVTGIITTFDLLKVIADTK